jgi:hypothetical protein
MKPIKDAQNSEESLRLLAAQRQIYTEAKRLNALLSVLALLTAVVIPLVLVFFPQVDKFWGLAGLGIFFLTRYLKSLEKNKRETASRIQEQFDIQLFGIPWNKSLAGSAVPPETIVAADVRFKGNRERLKDWYGSASLDLPGNITTLLCQRENFVWEYRQRQLFTQWLGVLFIGILAGGLALGLWNQALLLDFLLEYLSPLLPLLGLAGGAWLSHKKTEENLRQKAADISETLLQGALGITTEKLRDYQDAVLKNRQTGPMVPNWFFRTVGKKVGNEVNQATRMIIDKLNLNQQA